MVPTTGPPGSWRIHFFQRHPSDDPDESVPALDFFDGLNHRLGCLLVRNAADLRGSSIVCLGGLSKSRRQAAEARDYARIRSYRGEFERHRRVFN